MRSGKHKKRILDMIFLIRVKKLCQSNLSSYNYRLKKFKLLLLFVYHHKNIIQILFFCFPFFPFVTNMKQYLDIRLKRLACFTHLEQFITMFKFTLLSYCLKGSNILVMFVLISNLSSFILGRKKKILLSKISNF